MHYLIIGKINKMKYKNDINVMCTELNKREEVTYASRYYV